MVAADVQLLVQKTCWARRHPHILWSDAFHGVMILGGGYGHLEMP